MTTVIVQLLLSLMAGSLLFILWRRYVAPARLGFIVTLSFLARAFVALSLFWISWLQLPIASSLQIGDGIWFFGLDAVTFLNHARPAADQGLAAIIFQPRTVTSVTYVQALALCLYLFGRSTIVAMIINLFSYLGMAIIVIRWTAAAEEGNRPVLAARAIGLVAISLSPASMLWSLQPLKDPLFQFLVVAFVGAAVLWQQAWRSESPWKKALGAAAIMFAVMFAVAGLRWYFAFILLAVSMLFTMMLAFTSRYKLAAAASGLVLVMLLSQSFRLGGGAYVPERMARALTPATAAQEIVEIPSFLTHSVEHARGGFERSGGSTAIRIGRRAAGIAPVAKPPAAVVADARRETGAAPAPVNAIPASSPPRKRPSEASKAPSRSREATAPAGPAAAATTTSATQAGQQHEATSATEVARIAEGNAPAGPAHSSDPTRVASSETPPRPATSAPQPAGARPSTPAQQTAGARPVTAAPQTAAARPQTSPSPSAQAPTSQNPPSTTVAEQRSPTPSTPASSHPATTTHAREEVVAGAPASSHAAVPETRNPTASGAPVQAAARPNETSPSETAGPNASSSQQVATSTPKKFPAKKKATRTVAKKTAPASVPATPQQTAQGAAPQATPVATAAAPAPAPAPVPETPSGTLAGSEDSGAADDGSIASQSGSRAARFLAGATAMLLPQTVGERLGIIEIRGGRGLMWFTDLDTLIFDCLLVLIVVLLFRRARAASLRNPVFWLVVVMVVAVGAPLAYTVTNFGTLFRLRGMVYTGLALIPIALLTAGIRAEPKAPPDEPSDAAA